MNGVLEDKRQGFPEVLPDFREALVFAVWIVA